MDPDGRVRLDAVARYLQDVAIDDVDETGWGAPEHLWVTRMVRIDVLAPPLDDTEVELTTWCSGTGTLAAGRRLSLRGDRGGRVELDSVWVHLGPDARPARIEGFGVYAEAAGDRRVSTRLELPDPPAVARRIAWPARVTDLDLFGHVNNAVYWEAVEEHLADLGHDRRKPLRAVLEYRTAIDPGESVELVVHAEEGALDIAFLVGDSVRAVAWVHPLGAAGTSG
jgi:acyl-ACP thioesterase